MKVTVLFNWGALSDERSGLSLVFEKVKVKAKVILGLTISQTISLGIEHPPPGAHDQIFFSYVKVTVLFNWGALSDE
jgi:hypothetical protein